MTLSNMEIDNLLGMLGGTAVLVLTVRPIDQAESYDIIVRESSFEFEQALRQSMHDLIITNNGIKHRLLKVSIGIKSSDVFANPDIVKTWEICDIPHTPKMNEAIERDQQYQELVHQAVELVCMLGNYHALCVAYEGKAEMTQESVREAVRVSLFNILSGKSETKMDAEVEKVIKPFRELFARSI